MVAILNQAWLTETVRGIVRHAETSGDRAVYPILADALEEVGCQEVVLLLSLRDESNLIRIQRGDLTRWIAESDEEAAKVERLRIAKRNQVCLFRVGVTGNNYSLVELKTRITRQRPRGSGSKVELAKRLAERMDELASRRWKQLVKGQRKPSPRQAREMADAITAALDAVQSRCKERTIGFSTVVAAAKEADAAGTGKRDGGTITCNSYHYSWSTTSAGAERMPDGSIQVVLDRNETRYLSFPARWWKNIGVAAVEAATV